MLHTDFSEWEPAFVEGADADTLKANVVPEIAVANTGSGAGAGQTYLSEAPFGRCRSQFLGSAARGENRPHSQSPE